MLLTLFTSTGAIPLLIYAYILDIFPKIFAFNYSIGNL